MKQLTAVDRTKIIIHCHVCGEKYILRGRRVDEHFETGFKQCVCDNDNLEFLHIEELQHVPT